MALILGKDGHFQLSATAFSEGTPSYTTITNIEDLELSMDNDTDEVTTRAAGGYKWHAATLTDATITVTLPWDTTVAGYTILKDSFINKSPIAVKCFDGSSAGVSVGITGDFVVTKFDRDEGIGNAMRVSVELKLAYSSTAPTWGTL